MTAPFKPLARLTIPESAPFSPAQRAWLSGFFAGLTGPGSPFGGGATALSANDAAALLPAGPAPASNDDAPWHDPGMALDERMRLAEGRPISHKLMAAMAQQDCGQCGYTCAAYANALVDKSEGRLNLCAPGGKETLRALKALEAEIGAPSAKPAAAPAAAPAPVGEPGRTREAPAMARFIGRRKLNGAGSEKETWHIDIDLTDAGLDYVVGDSLGVFAENDLGLVDQVIAVLGAQPLTEVRGKPFREVLRREVSLGAAPDSLFQLIALMTGGAKRAKAQALGRGEDPDGDAATLDVLAALNKFAGVRPHPEAFVEALDALQPRLYSISSSNIATPGRVSLTVDAVRYVVGPRKRQGVASTFLGGRIAEGASLPVYVQRAHGFALPADPATPIIMVGPGTGVAPFRAFLMDRQATGAPGRNWLFFGHQRQASDFFYRDELTAMKESGHLTRLTLAWSRDGAEKVYVQDRMREVGADLWAWLVDGAHLYVCGDAKRMAKDVEAALVDIVAKHSARGVDESVAFVNGLKKAGRYQADVY